MRGLIALFNQYGSFLLFVLLELICFYLIIQFNEGHSKIYQGSANKYVGALYKNYNNVRTYFQLNNIVDSLAQENARLRTELKVAVQERIAQSDTATSVNNKQQYEFVETRVVNNSVNRHNNTLTLYFDENSDIRPHQGVIGRTGIIGIVLDTSAHYAKVLSVLNKQLKVSASIKGNYAFGSLAWLGTDPTTMNLEGVPKHIELTVGDTVVTSGYSSKFPEGIAIGRIDTFNLSRGSNFYNIKVRLINDLSSVKYAYVVNNLYAIEQQTLEGDK